MIDKIACNVEEVKMKHSTILSAPQTDDSKLTLYKNMGLDVRKVRKRAKIRIQYNQAPHLTQDTYGKVTTSQLDITNENQEVSPFPAGDHKASINRPALKHNKNKTEIT